MNNNLYKNPEKILKENFMVSQPLFFWMIIMMLVLAPLSTKTSVDLGFIISASLGVLCLSAFIAGWYNCIKFTISLKAKTYESVEERNKVQFDILKVFFPGVAEYMLPVIIMILIYGGTIYGIMTAYQYLVSKILIVKHFPADMLQVISTGTQQDISKYMQNNLSSDQLLFLFGILFLGFFIFVMFSLLVLWIAPSMFYVNKNPFVAIWIGLKFLFSHFSTSVAIIFVMFLINMMISILNLFMGNNFLSFIPLLLSLLYLMYYVITVFLYYESQTQNNCLNGTKFDREV